MGKTLSRPISASGRRVNHQFAMDMLDRGINSGDRVDLNTVCEEPGDYALRNLEAIGFDLPRGCAMSYFPEANVLIPWSHFDPECFVASYKSVPVVVTHSA